MTGAHQSSNDDEFLDPLLGELALLSGVTGIALGGSRARGIERPGSDWDFGVFVSEQFTVASVRELADELSLDGHIAELGEWGPVMNGGAWLEIEGRKVDLLWRELATIERLIGEAERGEFSVVRIPFFIAGIPSYVPVAELAFNRCVWGTVPDGRPMPDALRTRGAAWWRENARFDLDYAGGMAERGETAIAIGLLLRVAIELAHSRMCAGGRWVVNEKGLLAAAGLDAVSDLIAPAGTDKEVLDEVGRQLTGLIDGT